MNILILNGSPAGDSSITLQTMLYIEKFFPEHRYELLNVGQKIKALEKDFSPAGRMLEEAELIVFCYPVYTFLVPSQLHRFLELMKERGPDLTGKFATQISTSKHFYDTTAHEFIRENCADLHLACLRGLSADMEDLLKKKGRKEALDFFRHVLWAAEHGLSEDIPATAHRTGPLSKATVPESGREPSPQGTIALVADLEEGNEALDAMVRRFMKVSPYAVRLINLRDFPFSGGCLGCFHCAADGTCIYKDGFDCFLRENIQETSATVYAFSIRDHSMGSRFKMFDDRQFCNGHRTVTMGKPVGYLIDGDLSAEANLRQLIEARAQVGGNYLTRIAGNEADADREIDALAAELEYAVSNGYQQPANFYGVGGMKIFRDLIYTMQGMMKEDHRFYKEHGFYDFPQKRKGTILGMYLVGAMMNSEKLSRKLGANMTKGMLMPYRKVIEKAKPEKMNAS
ncbi:MAG: NAD(P)H-dependent oxidoreductase [Oscillospiraceae bacterium]|nr:NAD(P)H-dependent oxidoreductase [Oscillospiraceae bacterium]